MILARLLIDINMHQHDINQGWASGIQVPPDWVGQVGTHLFCHVDRRHFSDKDYSCAFSGSRRLL